LARSAGGRGAHSSKIAAIDQWLSARRHPTREPVRCLPWLQWIRTCGRQCISGAGQGATPPRTKWTRRVPHPVLIGHAASLTPYSAA
jgi:hypothetical protein